MDANRRPFLSKLLLFEHRAPLVHSVVSVEISEATFAISSSSSSSFSSFFPIILLILLLSFFGERILALFAVDDLNKLCWRKIIFLFVSLSLSLSFSLSLLFEIPFFGAPLNAVSRRCCSDLESDASDCRRRPRGSRDTGRHRLAQVSETGIYWY